MSAAPCSYLWPPSHCCCSCVARTSPPSARASSSPVRPDVAELPLTGGCLCGAVRFEVDEPPTGATYCHCTRCQRRTGTAASAQAVVVPGSVRIVSGDEVIRAYEPPDG